MRDGGREGEVTEVERQRIGKAQRGGGEEGK